MTTTLAAHDIEVRYEPHSPAIISSLAMTLESGEFVGIVGPNGSGKSTLVRALSRTLRPVAGSVLLGGDNLYQDISARQSAQQIAVVPQIAAVTLGFTVREVVRMGRSPHLPRRPFASETLDDERIVEDALRAAGVAHLSDRTVTTLSGGEWQRTLIARALAQQTPVILLDEPTANLDIKHQWETLTLLHNLVRNERKAVLAVLHDLNLAATYCDRLLLVSHGRVAAQGTPAEVLTPSNIQDVYGARVWVRCHPTTGRPVVLSLPELPEEDRAIPDAATSLHVHVICGGGTGAGLLAALRQRGIRATIAGLNRGDTDQEAAEMLGLAYAEEAPFSALSPETLAKSKALGIGANIVVVTDVPFGDANLANLAAAIDLQKAGSRVMLYNPPGGEFAKRDYAQGKATHLWEQLRANGAILVADTEIALGEIYSIDKD